MVKKIAASVFALTMIFGTGVLTAVNVFPETAVTASAYDEDDVLTYGDFEYSVLDDGTVEITRYTAWNNEEVEIPSEINKKKVTGIGDYAFAISYLESIDIPVSVKSIGEGAFSITYLEEVTIPSSVEKIGNRAFGYTLGSKIDSFKIYCYKGTAGEKYAIDNGFECELLKDDDVSSDPAPKPTTSLGNVNGDGVVDIEDATTIVNSINGAAALTDEQIKIADVDGNGTVDIEDVVAIINHINGVSSLF